MNTFSTSQLLKCAILMGSLIMPAASWADDHLLSVNGATVTQSATVTHAGALTQPLVLSSFDTPPVTVTLGQSQSLTVVSTRVKMCKPGTKGNLEWLDQGNTVVGVTGVLTSGTTATVPNNGYRLTLSLVITDNIGSSNGACLDSGKLSYTRTAGAVIDKLACVLPANSNANQNSCNANTGTFSYVNKLTTTYNFWNATHGVPEPGTMFLFLIGLLGLVWLNMARKRQMHGASV